MPRSGIELATLRSLARRSNQLSYAAATLLLILDYPRIIFVSRSSLLFYCSYSMS